MDYKEIWQIGVKFEKGFVSLPAKLIKKNDSFILEYKKIPGHKTRDFFVLLKLA